MTVRLSLVRNKPAYSNIVSNHNNSGSEVQAHLAAIGVKGQKISTHLAAIGFNGFKENLPVLICYT